MDGLAELTAPTAHCPLRRPASLTPVAVMADDLKLRRIVGALQSSCQIVCVGQTIDRLLESEPVQFDVAVLSGGAELLARGGPVERLQDLRPGCAIVIVIATSEPATIRRALRSGVDGFVEHAAMSQALAPAVAAVCAGYLSVPQAIRRQTDWSAFSLRERQVLQLVAHGLTNSEIGDRLYLSESTVKSHLSTGFRKLGVCSRAEAAAAVLDPDSGLYATAEKPEAAPERKLLGACA